MDRELFERLAKHVCMFFGDSCGGCPFSEFRKFVGSPSCSEAWKTDRKTAERVLASWIAGTTQVTESVKKEPETRREILQAADRCVCGDRDNQYGSPENSFKAIASMWNSYLYAKGLIENNSTEWKGIVPQDVAAMMVLFKMARVATGQNKADNWVDAAGYAACGGEIAAREADKNAQV